ncbi:MAG: tetratricopeptide repeat protein [Burkholderiales bacterium]|nr:tetratricopeptide repeat protein [Burkholderiales bacterium]
MSTRHRPCPKRVRARSLAVFLACAGLALSAQAVDLSSLWDFSRPDVSEQRFRAALLTASGDDALILRTQIARSLGLRRDFERAREELRAVVKELDRAGAEARTRYFLELGRTYASAAHPAELQTPQASELARSAYRQAIELARTASLDGLAIDAIHMMAFVETDAADQLTWAEEALRIVESSTQPAARRWEASIRNNLGHALHQLGRYDEALVQLRQAVAIRERGTSAEATRTAHWMVARTLRAMGRVDEALKIQLRLEREADLAGKPDHYVFEELRLLYASKGEPDRARHYEDRIAAATRKN